LMACFEVTKSNLDR